MTWLVGALVGVLALDRLACWAERRGWVHWRRRGRGAAEPMLGPVTELFAPSHRHVVEQRERQRLEVVLPGEAAPDLTDGGGSLSPQRH